MPDRHYTLLDGELRIYSAPYTPTLGPFAFKVPFIQADPGIFGGHRRPGQRLVMDRLRASADMRYQKEADDVIFEPIEISFECVLDESANTTALEQALRAGNVRGQLWGSTKGTSRLEGITLADFDGDRQQMRVINLEIIYTGESTAWGRRIEEVLFGPQDIRFGAADVDGVPFIARGLAYGPVSSISAFTSPSILSAQSGNTLFSLRAESHVFFDDYQLNAAALIYDEQQNTGWSDGQWEVQAFSTVEIYYQARVLNSAALTLSIEGRAAHIRTWTQLDEFEVTTASNFFTIYGINELVDFLRIGIRSATANAGDRVTIYGAAKP